MACLIQIFKVVKLGFRFYLVTFDLTVHSLLNLYDRVYIS